MGTFINCDKNRYGFKVCGKVREIYLCTETWQGDRHGSTVQVMREVGNRQYFNVSRASFRRVALAMVALHDQRRSDENNVFHTNYGA